MQLDVDAPPDLERLADFLASERAPPDAFSLSELDGLLTAVTIGPETIPPSEWLELVWSGEDPVFDSRDEAAAVLGAMLARCNEIAAGLDADPPSYEPFFWEDEASAPVIEEWCYGFMAGVAIRAEKWARLMNGRHGALLLPIMAHVPQFREESFDPAELVDFDPQLAIPALVATMHAYWRGRRARKKGAVRLTETPVRVKVGRNEPCPCGSGAKFKTCCGRPGAEPRPE